MPSQPEAQGDILKEFREGTFLSSLDRCSRKNSQPLLSSCPYTS